MKLTSFMKEIGFDDTKISNINKYTNNFDIKLPFLVINCDAHKDRLRKFKASAKKIKLAYYRLKCVYGKKFTDKQIYTMYKKELIKKTDWINTIELSINLSHINAWLKIINSNYEYGIVCEDDIIFKKTFIKNVNLILNQLKENNKKFDILYLWNGNWARTKSFQKRILKINEKFIINKELEQFNAGTVCYVISKKAAEYLYKRIFPIKDPVDMFIGKYYKRLKIFTLKMIENRKTQKDKSPLFVSGKWAEKFTDGDTDTQSTHEDEKNRDSLKNIITNYN